MSDPRLERQAARANLIANAATDRLIKDVLRRVRSIVVAAGGRWERGFTVDAARRKTRSALYEDSLQTVIYYHATLAARDWPSGPADDALRWGARRTVAQIGELLPDMATVGTARLLAELAGSHPESLSPDVAEGIWARVGR